MTNFSDLGLDPLLLKALDTEGYTTPTPIQAQAIPPILAGKDLMGLAQTGTGKTAAFALPILQRLALDRRPAPHKGVRALVLSPTRELANQIAESFRTYGRHMGFTVAVVYGGVGHKPQRDQLSRGVDIVVATPGRLIDHMTERNVVLEGTEILVLDEADQMMDLGFIRPIRQIVAKLSNRRQSLFFSATMPHEIGALAAELLRDPVKVAVTPVAKTADRVVQKVIHVEQTKKRALLVELFSDVALERTIVFTRTKRGADRVTRYLESAGVKCAAIHGNKSQGQRMQALSDFKGSRIRALIATDIAARGIDIDAISHVINYELPNIPESYVHRIGRTARAGAEGIAISLVDGEERSYLRDIERLTRQTIPSEDRLRCPKLAEVAAAMPAETRSAEDDRPEREGRRDGGQRRDGGRGERRGPPQHRGGDRRADGHAPRRDHGRDDRRPDRRDDRRPETRFANDAAAGSRDRVPAAPHSERPHQDRSEHRSESRARHDGPRDGQRRDAPRGGDRSHGENGRPPRREHSEGQRGPRREDGQRERPQHAVRRDGDRPHTPRGPAGGPEQDRHRDERPHSGAQRSGPQRGAPAGRETGGEPQGLGHVKFLHDGRKPERHHTASRGPRPDDRQKSRPNRTGSGQPPRDRSERPARTR